MVHPQSIPRDANGLVCGAWRLVHERPTFSGELGVVQFKDGVSVRPVAGHILSRLSAVYGHLLYLEPWGDLPRGFRMPEGHTAKVPEAALAKLKRAPWRVAPVEAFYGVPAADVTPVQAAHFDALTAEPPAPRGVLVDVFQDLPEPAPDALDAMSLDDLRALADLHDLKLDGRWADKRIRLALREAGITGD